MDHLTKFAISLVFLFISAAIPPPAQAATDIAAPREYTAVYEVLRKGSKLAEVTISLKRQAGTLTLHGYTHDTRDLADLLNVKGDQSVRGTWQDGHFLPDRYDFLVSLVGFKSAWHADFDWDSKVAVTQGDFGEIRLPLADGAVDPLSLFLNIRSYLAAGVTQMEVDIIDEDEIKHHLYEVEAVEALDTALGCMETTQVKRIRKSAKRISLAWYANDFDYIPVKLDHRKRAGKGLKMQLLSLEFDGQQVPVSEPCRLEPQQATGE